MDAQTKTVVMKFADFLEHEGSPESRVDARGVREFIRNCDRIDRFLDASPEIDLALGQRIQLVSGLGIILTLNRQG